MHAEYTALTIHSTSEWIYWTKDSASNLYYFLLHRPDVIREDDVSRLFMYVRGAGEGGPGGYKQNNIDDTAP